jgi:hypothetical protein
MAANLDEKPVIDEEAYYHDASLGGLWTASRSAVAITATTYGGIAFAYFYLRSLNSNNAWDPGGVTASVILGTLIVVMAIAAAVSNSLGARRLRKGGVVDWQVSAAFSLFLVLLAAGFQIWTLTRLPFTPSTSGYAGVFIAFAPVNAAVLIMIGYWVETLLMKSVRAKREFAKDGGLGLSSLPAAESFRANVEGLTFFTNFFALLSIVFFVIYYVIA